MTYKQLSMNNGPLTRICVLSNNDLATNFILLVHRILCLIQRKMAACFPELQESDIIIRQLKLKKSKKTEGNKNFFNVFQQYLEGELDED